MNPFIGQLSFLSKRLSRRQSRLAKGFTLTELAVVMVILALLIGGLLLPLAAQDEMRRTQETQKILTDIHEALIGYAIINDRLPCPAMADSNGLAKPESAGNCVADFSNGFVPAVTLGLMPIDQAGFAIDAWGNRIRYALSTASSNALSNGIRTYYQSSGGFPSADLRVCTSSTAISAGKCANPETTNLLTKSAVAVIFSVGKNGGDNGGADEQVNKGASPLFISHAKTDDKFSNGEFDDIVIWLSPNILYSRMIAAGRLP